MSHVTVPGACYRLEDDPHYNPHRTYGAGYPYCSVEHEQDVKRRMSEKLAEYIKGALTEAEEIGRAINHGHD